jgi:hypothetical protein
MIKERGNKYGVSSTVIESDEEFKINGHSDDLISVKKIKAGDFDGVDRSNSENDENDENDEVNEEDKYYQNVRFDSSAPQSSSNYIRPRVNKAKRKLQKLAGQTTIKDSLVNDTIGIICFLFIIKLIYF